MAPSWANSADFVRGLWPEAKARGVSKAVFDAAFSGFELNAKIMELSRKQPEFSQTVGQYVTKRVSDTQTPMARRCVPNGSRPSPGAERYGVQPEVVLAIWGIETNFGGYMGDIIPSCAGDADLWRLSGRTISAASC